MHTLGTRLSPSFQSLFVELDSHVFACFCPVSVRANEACFYKLETRFHGVLCQLEDFVSRRQQHLRPTRLHEPHLAAVAAAAESKARQEAASEDDARRAVASRSGHVRPQGRGCDETTAAAWLVVEQRAIGASMPRPCLFRARAHSLLACSRQALRCVHRLRRRRQR